MIMAADGRDLYESSATGVNFLRLEINEEPHKVSSEAGPNISIGVSEISCHQCGKSATVWISELEQMLKQKIFTRAEIQRLIKLLHSSRTAEDSSTTVENLPNELLSNIFIRLLAKQLVQMRCVSKSWNALLSQSSFIKSHLEHSIHSNDQILLAFFRYSRYDFMKFTTHSCQSPHLKLYDFINFPSIDPSIICPGTTAEVIGAVNGLIGFSYGDSVIHIWNPSLSATLRLPPYSISSHVNDSIKMYFRFAFDPQTDDYKVVKLIGLISKVICNVNKNVKQWLQIEINSMRKGSWELITQRFPSHIIGIDNPLAVCVDGHDGHLHWLGYTDDDSERIVSFDLGLEKVSVIPFPDHMVHRSNCLAILGRKLCVVSSCWRGNYDELEVWVMDESWVKRHVIELFDDNINNYGFTSNNEYLYEEDGRLVLYDPVADKTKIIQSYRAKGVMGVNAIVEYVDSLVWVAP